MTKYVVRFFIIKKSTSFLGSFRRNMKPSDIKQCKSTIDMYRALRPEKESRIYVRGIHYLGKGMLPLVIVFSEKVEDPLKELKAWLCTNKEKYGLVDVNNSIITLDAADCPSYCENRISNTFTQFFEGMSNEYEACINAVNNSQKM